MSRQPDLPLDFEGISPRRQAFDRALQQQTRRMLGWAAEHWLAIINSISFVALALPTIVAPALRALGVDSAADAIFWAYAPTCHQMASRSFFLFGQQMAFCERNTGIFGAFFLFGIVYLLFRRRLRSLPFWLLVAYSFPMAVDGFTQLFGWRESTWELRVLTGGFFALGVVWYTFPHFDLLMRLVHHDLQQREARPA